MHLNGVNLPFLLLLFFDEFSTDWDEGEGVSDACSDESCPFDHINFDTFGNVDNKM